MDEFKVGISHTQEINRQMGELEVPVLGALRKRGEHTFVATKLIRVVTEK